MPYVLGFEAIDRTQVGLVGGKGASLGELSRIDSISVPGGFCATTEAFDRALAGVIDTARLRTLDPSDHATLRQATAAIRAAIEATPLPDEIRAAIVAEHARHGADGAYAVRSSATAEDLPTASFAGQQDTYLNVAGADAIIRDVRRCWASLYSERAVAYRIRNGFDHDAVRMAVVVQRMVAAQASGVVFTADPISGNRKLAVVEASAGLGDAFVSGLVNADSYTVRDGEVIVRTSHQTSVLTDGQAVHISEIGRRIEVHFGAPQDIEWCLAEDAFQIVQSRPITTLFPIPPETDGATHVYLSVGHNQMMTDAMKPLGLSFWQMTTPRPMQEAGGRLFVDVTPTLASPAARAALLGMMAKTDPLMRDAMQTLLDRGDVVQLRADEDANATAMPRATQLLDPDDAIVGVLIAETEESIAKLRRDIREHSGTSRLDCIVDDIQELRRLMSDPRSQQVYMTAMEATWWLNEHIEQWLGEANVADTLTQSVPHNVTSEMGLALLDLADVIRAHPAVIAFLETVTSDEFVDELATIEGGDMVRAALHAFLAKYGMRAAGEIDITRPRWAERPSTLVPLLLANVKNFAPGEAARRFEHGRRAARAKEEEVLDRLRALPEGQARAAETKLMIDRVRAFMGYREHPKYGMVSRYFVYKRALLEEAARLDGLREPEDIYFLRFDELREVVAGGAVDHDLIGRRKEEFRSFEPLRPPRVLTSDGEGLSGSFRRDDVPPGALVGLPASTGTVEGRARVVLDMAQADVEADDILVTAYTDPSWTPLFVSVAGLVTEVGGMMTHGAVVAREYGLPAVVAVEHATTSIRDGQRIRVHGSDGYVEILSDAPI
jgi:pyruvate,water dikinase